MVDIGYSIGGGLREDAVGIGMDSNFEDEIGIGSGMFQLMREEVRSSCFPVRRVWSMQLHFRHFSALVPQASGFSSGTMTLPTSDTKDKVIVTYQDHPRFSCAQCAAVLVHLNPSHYILHTLIHLEGSSR